VAEEELEDYDGLGMLFSGQRLSQEDGDADTDAAQPLIEQLCRTFRKTPSGTYSVRLVGGNGMGHSAASISTVFDLTCVDGKAATLLQSLWMQVRGQHTFKYCFVSVLSMDKYLHPSS
jgi:hypothetical protein